MRISSPTPAQVRASAAELGAHLGIELGEVEEPVALDAVSWRRRASLTPASLAQISPAISTRAPRTRSASPTATWCAAFAASSSIRPTSSCARATSASWKRCWSGARAERVAAIPFGGGTSVVGGVTPEVGPGYNGVVSVDLGALDRVLEVDAVSRSARIQGGALGPVARGAAAASTG